MLLGVAMTALLVPCSALAHGKHGHQSSGGATTNGLPLSVPTWKLLPTTSRSHPFGGDAWSNRGVGLAKHGFVEEEYLVSGDARVYQSVPKSDYVAKVINQSHYTTRAIVRRPRDMRTWSGNVLVEYMNVSDGLDLQIVWSKLHDQIFSDRDVYIAFTGKGNVIPVLQRFDPDRYGDLEMPNPVPPDQQACGTLPDDPGYDPGHAPSKLYENGLIYDMWSGIGLLLKSGSSPLGRPARRLYATGQSQSANALVNYYSWFGGTRTTVGREPVYDGVFAETPTDRTLLPVRLSIMVHGALNQCSPPLPEEDPQLAVPDRGTPFFSVNSQWDAWKSVQPPSRHFRNWQVAGANHVDRQQYDHIYPIPGDVAKSGAAGPDALPWQVGIPLELYSPAGWFCDDTNRPEVGLPQAQQMAWYWLKRWATQGKQPPVAPYLTRSAPGGPLVLDSDGNALGGLRMPYIQTPIAKYTGVLWGDCAEAQVPFTPERLAQLYPTHEAYVQQVAAAARDLVRGGFLHPDDATDIVDRAEDRPVP